MSTRPRTRPLSSSRRAHCLPLLHGRVGRHLGERPTAYADVDWTHQTPDRTAVGGADRRRPERPFGAGRRLIGTRCVNPRGTNRAAAASCHRGARLARGNGDVGRGGAASGAAVARWRSWSPVQYRPMVRLAYLLTGSTAVAEDLVQDEFVRLQRSWSTVREPAAYLRRSVVNVCNSHHRRVGVERSHFHELVTDTVADETPIVLDALPRAALPPTRRCRCCASTRTAPRPRSPRRSGVDQRRSVPSCTAASPCGGR